MKVIQLFDIMVGEERQGRKRQVYTYTKYCKIETHKNLQKWKLRDSEALSTEGNTHT